MLNRTGDGEGLDTSNRSSNTHDTISSIGFNLTGLDGSFSLDSTIRSETSVIARAIIACLTVLVCSVVTFILLRSKELRQFSNLIVITGIVIDMVTGLGQLVSVWAVGQELDNTVSNAAFCQIGWVVTIATYGWSFWAIFLISYNLFDRVSRPLRPRLSPLRAVVIVAGALTTGTLVSVIPLTGFTRAPEIRLFPDNKTGICRLYGNGDPSQDTLKSETVFSFVWYAEAMVIPTVCTVVYFSRLILVAWRKLQPVGQDSSRNAERSRVLALIRTKGFIYVTAIVTCKIVLVTPQHITLILNTHFGFSISYSLIFVLCAIANIHCLVTSILYVLWLKTFRLRMAEVLCCVDRRRRNSRHMIVIFNPAARLDD